MDNSIFDLNFCWVCGSLETADGDCTNPTCPRYVAPAAATAETKPAETKTGGNA